MDDESDRVRQINYAAGVCPHIDRDDARCASRFNINRIEQAFSVCFGSYHGCPMYHRINSEDVAATDATTASHLSRTVSPLIAITTYASDVPLRPTGT